MIKLLLNIILLNYINVKFIGNDHDNLTFLLCSNTIYKIYN